MIENSSLQANSITIDESAATEQFCRSEHSSVEEILSYQVVIVGGLLESNPRLKTLLNIHFEQNTSVNYFEMSEEDALETFSQRDDDRPPETVFIIPDFETSLYGVLKKLGMRILGPPCVVDLLTRDFRLDSPRIGDMFACSLLRAIIVFSGFERGQRSELSRLTKIAHFLGARVKQEVNGSVTHLISPTVRSTLYDDAVGLGVATLSPDWLRHCWERRHDTTFVGTDQIITRDFFILPFSGLQIAFHGFSTSDLREIEPLVVDNGGLLVSINSSMLTHIVVHHTGSSDFLSPTKEGVWVVSSKWFYDSIQFQIKKPEAAHSIGFDRKKKKLEDFSSPFAMSSPRTQKKASPLQNMKKRLSRETHIDGEDRLNKRYFAFKELVQTERNYVEMLTVMLEIFRERITAAGEGPFGPLMTKEELRDTFSYLPPIINIHEEILRSLEALLVTWNDKSEVGRVYEKNVDSMIRAYSAYINFFEKTKILVDEKMKNQKFLSCIKSAETESRCQRQSFKDLLIRPVQRLPSVILTYKEILKHTDASSPDHRQVVGTIESLTMALNHINEDKRRTNEQLQNVEIYNRIDECPADFLSSRRTLIFSIDCNEVCDFNSKSRYSVVTLFIMCDCIEVAYKLVKKAIGKDLTLSPFSGSTKSLSLKKHKSFKHAYMIPFKFIAHTIELPESNTFFYKNTFGLCFRSKENDEPKTRYFQIIGENAHERLKSVSEFLNKSLTCAKMIDESFQPKTRSMMSITKAFENLKFKTTRRISRAFSINNSYAGLPRSISVMSQISPDIKPTNDTGESCKYSGDTMSYANEYENIDVHTSQIIQPINSKKSDSGSKKYKFWRRSIQPHELNK